jgi:hypothetical protein
MKKELSEFTKKAIAMANEQIYNERFLPDVNETSERYERPFDVSFKEGEWEFLIELIDAEEKKCKAIIKKIYARPSETIASSQTREKYNKKIDKLNTLKSTILEGFF